jgi:hypothetical protein
MKTKAVDEINIPIGIEAISRGLSPKGDIPGAPRGGDTFSKPHLQQIPKLFQNLAQVP